MASKAVKIALEDETREVLLVWDRFDGDDCFEEFRIIVTPRGTEVRVYEFGPCAVHAVRKMSAFLSDHAQQSVGGGFRHPDIRTYDWQRSGSDLKLVVKFEGSRLANEHVMKSPKVTITEEPYSYE